MTGRLSSHPFLDSDAGPSRSWVVVRHGGPERNKRTTGPMHKGTPEQIAPCGGGHFSLLLERSQGRGTAGGVG